MKSPIKVSRDAYNRSISFAYHGCVVLIATSGDSAHRALGMNYFGIYHFTFHIGL